MLDAYSARPAASSPTPTQLARHRLRLPGRRGDAVAERPRRGHRRGAPGHADRAEQHLADRPAARGPRPQLRTKLLGSRATTWSSWPATSARTARSRPTSRRRCSRPSSPRRPSNLTNSIVFSAGCHSGYNIVDARRRSRTSPQPLDWAAGVRAQGGDADRRHGLPVRRHRLPRVQRADLRRLRPAAARRQRAGVGRQRAGARQAGLPRRHADIRGAPRQGAARGDALRPADAQREPARPGAITVRRPDRGHDRPRLRLPALGLAPR